MDSSAESKYFPGFTETFNYTVTDRRGTVIDEVTATNTTIMMFDDSFVTLLYIDGDGVCQNCEDGVLLSEISVAENLGENITFQLEADNNRLLLGQSEITFNITGCPIGYGADSNNNTCTVCDTFTYNVEDNFVRNCLSCDPDDNEGIVLFICNQSKGPQTITISVQESAAKTERF